MGKLARIFYGFRQLMKKEERDFLFELLKTPSPTGFEMPGQRVWAKWISPFATEVSCDAYGSTWALLKGKLPFTVMLAAHADEIGYIVKHIDSNGFIRIDRIGGSDAATAQGRRLNIFGDQGIVAGIIGNTAIHLRSGSEEKVPAVHELWVDVGASSAKDVEKMGLRVGHPAVYQDEPLELANHRIVGRALDNRIGSFIIAQVMKRLSKEKKLQVSVLCLNAVQEEIGGNGAEMATYRLKPDVCVCLDVTHATDTPGIDVMKCGEVKLGAGPTLTHGSSNHPLLVKRLDDVAKAAKIPIQHESSGRFTGTDTDVIFKSHEGVPSALVSLPLRCMHSVVETAHWGDVQHTIELLCELILSLKPTDSFEQKL